MHILHFANGQAYYFLLYPLPKLKSVELLLLRVLGARPPPLDCLQQN
jgi:hypothetical protein